MNASERSHDWAAGDVYSRVFEAIEKAGLSLDSLTVESLAPLDHFHARGFPATVELADRLPIRSGDLVLDLGCGIGGPARYIAQRFDCRVHGIDITPAFIDVARRLTAAVRLDRQVVTEIGDGLALPFDDATFDAAYTQHVTMNIADRPRFFAGTFRVLKQGGRFALSEHGLGPTGDPAFPVPWSDDGTGSHLVTPEETVSCLQDAGFADIAVEETGPQYVAAYRQAIAAAATGKLPPFGTHVLLGESAPQKTRNAARNIEEGRTRPVLITCAKPS